MALKMAMKLILYFGQKTLKYGPRSEDYRATFWRLFMEQCLYRQF